MRLTKQISKYRAICILCITALMMPIFTTLTVVSPASAQDAVTELAVIDFTNASQMQNDIYTFMATDAVVVELLRSGRYNIIPSEVVKSKMEEMGLRDKGERASKVILNEDAYQRIGREIGVQAVLSGEIKAVEFDSKKGQASVRIGVRIMDVESGEWMNGALATGVSNKRIGDTSGKENDLIIEAINDAAAKAVSAMVKYIIPFATVMGNLTYNEVLLNKGKQQGIHDGMEMIVTRRSEAGGRETVGKIRVTTTSTSDSIAKVIEAPKGVKAEDHAMAVFKLPRDTGRGVAAPVTDAKEKIASKGRTIIGLAVLVGLLAMVGTGKRGGPGGGAIAMSVGASDIQVVTGGGGNLIAWNTPPMIADVNIEEYHIWRDSAGNLGGFPIFAGNLEASPLNSSIGNYHHHIIDSITGGDIAWVIPSADATTTETPTNSPASIPVTQPGESHVYSVSCLYRREVPGGTGQTITQYWETLPTIAGRATYLTEPELISPGDWTGTQELALSNITFTFYGVKGATDYVIEVSSTPDFQRTNTWVNNFTQLTPDEGLIISKTYTNVLSLSAELSGVPSGNVLWWRVGAKSSYDTNAPFPAAPNPTLTGAKNTRYVYTPNMQAFSFKRL